jgi:YggT family protein
MQAIDYLFKIYEMIILARVIISWTNADTGNAFVRLIYRLTEPVLEPVRRILPMERMGLDFSPLIVLVALEFVDRMLFRFIK